MEYGGDFLARMTVLSKGVSSSADGVDLSANVTTGSGKRKTHGMRSVSSNDLSWEESVDADEQCSRRFLHRRITGCTRRSAINAKRRHRLRYPSRRYRRCGHRFPEDDGRADSTRTSTYSTERREQGSGVGCLVSANWIWRKILSRLYCNSQLLFSTVHCMGEAQGVDDTKIS